MEDTTHHSVAALTQDVRRIDETGQKILEQVGVRVQDEEYLKIFESAGADVDFNEQRVRFSPAWLRKTLDSAPRRFTLCSRDGKNDVRLGEGRIHFVNGGRVFRILDMGTGGYRRTMLRDVAHTAAIVNELDNLKFYIIACQAHDIGPENYHLNDFYSAFNFTTKHVMGGCDRLEGAKQVWELASALAGGPDKLRERPFFSVITNPISPLTVDSQTLGILKFCCERGIPVTCAPAPITGATAPATLAGTLAQMHAEALAGVAFTQVFQAGAKALYGAVPTAMDLRTMDFTMGSVEMAMMNAAAVRLAKMHEFPIYGSAGVTESKRPDIQAGVEKTLSYMAVAQAGADVIHLAAGMLDSGNSISYEQYVIDNEIIGMILRMARGIDVDEGTLALEVIDKVGPGGNFVIEDHTIEYMEKEFFYPKLAVRSNFDIWEQKGRPTMLSRANERVEKILDDSRDGLLDPSVIEEIKERFPGIGGA